jgi:hypothetical protein
MKKRSRRTPKKKATRISSVLRELVKKHGSKEIAKRTGFSRRAIEYAARSGRPSKKLKEKISRAKKRSDIAKRAAKTKRSKKAVKLRVERSLPKKVMTRLRRTMKAFVRATKYGGADEIKQTYRAWRRAKVPTRRDVPDRIWEKVIQMLGSEVGLADTGIFSKQSFKKS